MSDADLLSRIQSFLAAPDRGERPSNEERSAWADFYEFYDRVIRAVVRRVADRQTDIDDFA